MGSVPLENLIHAGALKRWILVGAHKGVPMKGREGPCAFLSLSFPSWVMEVAGLAPACHPVRTCLLHFQSSGPANHELPPPKVVSPNIPFLSELYFDGVMLLQAFQLPWRWTAL